MAHNLPACVILPSSTETLKCRHTEDKHLGSCKVGDLPAIVTKERRDRSDYMMDGDPEGTWRVEKWEITGS